MERDTRYQDELNELVQDSKFFVNPVLLTSVIVGMLLSLIWAISLMP